MPAFIGGRTSAPATNPDVEAGPRDPLLSTACALLRKRWDIATWDTLKPCTPGLRLIQRRLSVKVRAARSQRFQDAPDETALCRIHAASSRADDVCPYRESPALCQIRLADHHSHRRTKVCFCSVTASTCPWLLHMPVALCINTRSTCNAPLDSLTWRALRCARRDIHGRHARLRNEWCETADEAGCGVATEQIAAELPLAAPGASVPCWRLTRMLWRRASL